MASTVDPYWDMPSPRAIRLTDIHKKMAWKFCLSKHWVQLHSVYAFSNIPSWLPYLQRYFPSFPFTPRLIDAIWAVTEVIQEEDMLDPHNPYMVICNAALEHALGYPAFHVAQIRGILLESMHVVRQYRGKIPDCLDREHLIMEEFRRLGEAAKLPHDGKRYDPRRPVDFPADAMVDLSSPLREFLLKKVFHFEEKEDGYTYKEIRGHLRWYLHEHRSTIVNYRNRAICNIKNDPLRRVFLCQAFYCGQLADYLTLHLTPRPPKPRTTSSRFND